MSERLSLDPEQFESLLKSPERHKAPESKGEKRHTREQDPSKKLQEARAELSHIDTQENPLKHIEATEKASQPAPSTYVNRELKSITLRRELQHIRRKLPAPQRALSKVIHQPAVRAISEGAGKTVSRPSGLLGGGITAFVGTSGYLYLAKHRGFEYNYGVFLALFVGGFALGLALELAVHLATSSRRKAD